MIFKLFLLSTLVGLASSACFDNGDKEIGGSCYKFVAQKLSFEDARNWCHYKNPVTASYLAYVPNQFTSNFLASYARSAFGTNDGSFWIGLSRKSGGSWSWDAGFPVGYTNFGDQVGQNYVAESIVNAKWNTFGASDTNFFVCGYDPAAPPTFAPQTPGPSGPTPTMRATTQQVPTTTELASSTDPLTAGPCQCMGRWVYNGDLAIAFEYIKDSDGSTSVVNFITNTLLSNPDSYGLSSDVNGNQASQLTIVPYPDSSDYPIYPYGSIRSPADIGNFVDAYSGIQSDSKDPSISTALDFINYNLTNTSNTRVVLLVGSDGSDVTTSTESAKTLKDAGYTVITVAQTAAATVFQPLSSGSQFAFHIGDGNDNEVANKISNLLLDISFTCFDDGSSTPSPLSRCSPTQETTASGPGI